MHSIDNTRKEYDLMNMGYDEFYLSTLCSSSLSSLWYDEIAEQNMIEQAKAVGEDEGESHRIWLSGLNGKCLINGHTDIMSVVACKNTAGEDCLSIQVNSPDDKSTIWVDISDFTYDVADLIYNQVMNYKK